MQSPLQLIAKRIEILWQIVFAFQAPRIEARANQRLQGQTSEGLLSARQLKGFIAQALGIESNPAAG
jgi:hypothetical protein